MPLQAADDSNFQALTEAAPLTVVKYYADWCGSCRLFAPKFKALADKPENGGIAFLDVDAEKATEARRAARVSNLPYVALFRNGQLLEGDFTSKPEYVQELIDKHRSVRA